MRGARCFVAPGIVAGMASVLLTLVTPTCGKAAPWRVDRFLIGGWVPGPSRDARMFLELDAAGLDYFHTDFPGAAESRDVVARLDSLAAARPGFDLKAIVHYRVPFDDAARFTENDDPVRNWDRIRPGFLPAGGMNRRSTLGWHLLDEPTDRAAIDRVGEVSRRLAALPATASQLAYTNLLPIGDPASRPTYARAFGSDTDSAYVAYLRAYLGQFDATGAPAQVLSYGHYPFLEGPRPGANWFRNLARARDAALAYSRGPTARVALWVIIQSSNFQPKGKAMSSHFTPAMLRWQAWSAVAYGAKGIAYWTIAPAYDQFAQFGFGAGFLDRKGARTGTFASVRALNAELHALGPRLVELEPVGAWHGAAGGQAKVRDGGWDVTADGRGALRGVKGVVAGVGRADALVGVLRHVTTDETWIVVVNKHLSAERSFRVELADVPAGIERIRRSDGRPVPVPFEGTAFATTSIPAGTAELFRLVAR